MSAHRNPASDHIREMDRRIQERQGENDRLRKSDQDDNLNVAGKLPEPFRPNQFSYLLMSLI